MPCVAKRRVARPLAFPNRERRLLNASVAAGGTRSHRRPQHAARARFKVIIQYGRFIVRDDWMREL
jgi:hypothetical protein